jgi:hypothetical protein
MAGENQLWGQRRIQAELARLGFKISARTVAKYMRRPNNPGQQMIECCAWYRAPPRFLIHDRDSIYGAVFDRRVRNLGISQVRTPFRSPRANTIAERKVARFGAGGC